MPTHSHQQMRDLQRRIDKAKELRFKAEERMVQLQRQRDELLGKLQELGIRPADLPAEVERLQQEIGELLAQAQSLLPPELLR